MLNRRRNDNEDLPKAKKFKAEPILEDSISMTGIALLLIFVWTYKSTSSRGNHCTYKAQFEFFGLFLQELIPCHPI